MTTIVEAKRRVIEEWHTWSKQRNSFSENDMFLFFAFLKQNKSELLEFNCADDKWQRIHGWLLQDELIQSKLRTLNA